MSKHLAVLILVLGCGGSMGGHHGGGGGGGYSQSSSPSASSGGGHSWAPSASSSRPTLEPSHASHASHPSHAADKGDGAGDVLGDVIPAIAEALIVGAGDYDVDTQPDEPKVSVPVGDPCQVCPLDDPCGACAGYGGYACRDNVAGVLSRCESTAPPNTPRPPR